MEPLWSPVVPRETSKPRPTGPPRHQKFLSPFRQKRDSCALTSRDRSLEVGDEQHGREASQCPRPRMRRPGSSCGFGRTWTGSLRWRTISLWCLADVRKPLVDQGPPPRRSSSSDASRRCGCARVWSGLVVVRAHRPLPVDNARAYGVQMRSPGWPTGGLWRHRNFLKLWSAETVSQFGTQVSHCASTSDRNWRKARLPRSYAFVP